MNRRRSLRPDDDATVDSLRRDVAHQITKFVEPLGGTQATSARRLGIPQPTMSKIVNGRVKDISLELLIRIAVRAKLPLALVTGRGPMEAGAFVAAGHTVSGRTHRSRLGASSEASLTRTSAALTPSQRLEAFFEHNQLLSELHAAGSAAVAESSRDRCIEP
jgi:predicted XRE-type DNA-binding protein